MPPTLLGGRGVGGGARAHTHEPSMLDFVLVCEGMKVPQVQVLGRFAMWMDHETSSAYKEAPIGAQPHRRSAPPTPFEEPRGTALGKSTTTVPRDTHETQTCRCKHGRTLHRNYS